jgi:UDP-glucose 4-epimerase
VFGADFDTPDGSCLRDYVHVTDLAAAHLAALRAPLARGAFEAVNVGAGAGRSVRQVIETTGRIVGRPCRTPSVPAATAIRPAWWRTRRRPAGCWAGAPPCSDLDRIVADAAAWARAPQYGVKALAA